MKIIKGKAKYEQTFFRFLEYLAKVKAASLKRKVILKMAFDELSKHEVFSPYLNNGATLENLYNFYFSNKEHEFLKEFFQYRKQKVSGRSQVKTYKKVTGISYVEFYRSRPWIKLSREVKLIYGKKCMKCGCSKSVMHTDHIIPRSLDLSLELDINNLQVLCNDCNVEKSNLNTIDYRTEIDKLKLQAYLKKEPFVNPEITFKSWLDYNRKKLTKKQIEILIHLWDNK